MSAIEIYGDLTRRGPMVVTCEHASNDVEPPLSVAVSDAPWLETHWGWDPGARDVARGIIDLTHSVGVFSTFSRLVCDPNRPPTDATWIRESVEGHALTFNARISDRERERRRRLYHDPYHAAVDAMMWDRRALDDAFWLISVHSFTPEYMGERRAMEIGVLYDDFDAIAASLADRIAARGFRTALNEPYSGYDHLMYAANRHGRAHNLHYLELEVRQDLITDQRAAERVGHRIGSALTELIEDVAAGKLT